VSEALLLPSGPHPGDELGGAKGGAGGASAAGWPLVTMLRYSGMDRNGTGRRTSGLLRRSGAAATLDDAAAAAEADGVSEFVTCSRSGDGDPDVVAEGVFVEEWREMR
jgi:hypothetical protein